MKPLLVSASLALSLSVTSVSHAADIINLDQFPSWFKKAMKKEQKPEKESELKVEALNASGKVLGKVSLEEHAEGVWYYQIDIGIKTPIECYTFTTFDGPANSLYVVKDNAFTNLPSVYNKPISAKYNFALDTGTFGGTPYMQVDTMYHVGEDNDKLVGLMKGMSAQTGDALQVCIHNEIGYRETFKSVFESWVAVFAAGVDSNNFYESVYKLSVNGIPVGYVSEAYSTDKDGDVETQKRSSFVFPVDASNLSRADSVAREWGSSDGALINATTYSIENSTLGSQYSLEKKEQKWLVTGQLQGKAIDSTLDYADELSSGYGSYLALVDLMNSDKKSAELPMWVPEADPATKLDVTLGKIPNNPDANLSFDMGPIVMQFLASKEGVFQKGSLQQAGLTMNMDLLYVKGLPKQP